MFLLSACYQPERDCKAFKTGAFSYTALIDGEEKTTTFVRDEAVEVDYFEGKRDTSSIRWLNDCEYILKKIKPKNRTEEKQVHIKILSTDENSYTFEYGFVGSSQKSRGTAIKIKP